MALTDKQRRFVEEYLIDLNATQAAIRTGYSPKSARQQGAANLSRPEIAQAIAAAKKARSERVGIDQNWVVERLREVAERCMRHEAVLDRDGKPTGEYTFNANGANKSLELIGKHIGMFVERSVSTNVNYAVSGEPLSEEEWEKRHGRAN